MMASLKALQEWATRATWCPITTLGSPVTASGRSPAVPGSGLYPGSMQALASSQGSVINERTYMPTGKYPNCRWTKSAKVQSAVLAIRLLRSSC